MHDPVGPHSPGDPGSRGAGGLPAIQQLLATMLNPANAAHGDAVFTEEALDRVISQFMEANGSSAPGPASAAAIAALPKKLVDKSMMGNDGKAECSVCMDNVEIGDQVTVLPCQHWFHGECVGAWLKEHDTCPHCRQGIMPKNASDEATSPRSPSQEPRNRQPPLSLVTDGSRGFHFRSQESPLSGTEQRRSSVGRSGGGRNGGEGSSGGGGGGGISGWVRNRFGGGNSSNERSSSH